MQNFEQQLTGGHPNSLGNTIAVVDAVLANPNLFDELFHCYFSTDEVVRLRTSNAMKRIAKANKPLLVPYLGRLIEEIAQINQASTQWTLAQLFDWYAKELTEAQHTAATAIMKHNLANHTDWIVLNNTMEALAKWAKADADLRQWVLPHLETHSADARKSVASRAKKLLTRLSG